jgi:hypothetical protein
MYWLAFVDDRLPEDQQFLGVVIAPHDEMIAAVNWAHEHHVNPGGEVHGFDLGGRIVPPTYVGRLLTLAEVQKLKADGFPRPSALH